MDGPSGRAWFIVFGVCTTYRARAKLLKNGCAALSWAIVLLFGASVLAAEKTPTPPSARQGPFVRQDVSRGNTVTGRARPDYDAVGLRVGSFFVYPTFEFTPTWDTNIFSTTSNRKSDLVIILSPEFSVRSNWRRHELNFGARADIGRYKSFQRENYEDASVIINGRRDIRRFEFIFAGLRWAQRHEDRGSPDDTRGIRPTKFWGYEGIVGYQRRFNRVTARVQALYRYIDYRDTPFLGGGSINQDDRDRHEFTGTARITVRISPRLQVFGEGVFYYVNYSNPLDDALLDRDNKGFGINGGVVIELGNKLFGEVFGGFRRQTYDDALLPTISGISGGMSLTWNPSGLTTVKGTVVRTIEQTTLVGSSGSFSTQGRISVDHELRRNVILSAFGSFQQDDFAGITRRDRWIRAGLHGKFLHNRYLRTTLGYEYTHRQSTVGNQSFTRHLFILSIKGQL